MNQWSFPLCFRPRRPQLKWFYHYPLLQLCFALFSRFILLCISGKLKIIMNWIFVVKAKLLFKSNFDIDANENDSNGVLTFHPREWFDKFHFPYVYSNRKNLIYPFNNLFNCPCLDVKGTVSRGFCCFRSILC